MPRTLNATLEAALDNNTGDPYFLATITNINTSTQTWQGQVFKYTLRPLELDIIVETNEYIYITANDRMVLRRGLTIAGVNYTLDTSDFCILEASWNGNFQTFKCHLIPKEYYSDTGDDTYSNIITAFCTYFGKTAVFKDAAAAWLAYKFFPTGRNLIMPNAQRFFELLKKKYFIFAADNGNNEILFYTAFTDDGASDYSIDQYRYQISFDETLKRRFMWRDENGTLHYSSATAELSRTGAGGFVIASNGNIYMLDGLNIVRSTDNGATWTTLTTPIPVTTFNGFTYSGSNLVAIGWVGGTYRIVYSTDEAETWNVAKTGMAVTDAIITLDNDVVLVASRDGTGLIHRSTDNGVTWSEIIIAASQSLFADLGGGIVHTYNYYSTDYGSSWTAFSGTTGFSSVIKLGSIWYGTPAITGNGEIWKSTDGTNNRTLVQDLGTSITVLAKIDDNTAFAVVDTDDLWRTTDGGATWVFWDDDIADNIGTLTGGILLATYNSNTYLINQTNPEVNQLHNLGFLESTAAHPSRTSQLPQPKFDPFPIHLKYLCADFITINLDDVGSTYEITCAEVTERLDTELDSIPWRCEITTTQWITTTEAGNLPSTIENVSAYTPLATINFSNNLDSGVNNLQALADKVDDLEIPSFNDAEGDPADVAGSAADGTSANTARRDHVHKGATATHNHDATYAPIAKGVTNGDSHNHIGGDGGQIAYADLSDKPAAETNANDIFRCDNPGGYSAFIGTIATLPGGATLTYNVTSGNESAMVPTSTSQLGKIRLYNTTRGTSALISNCVTGTNTITLTANVPAGWAVTDAITIASQTIVGGFNWMDIEITSGPTGRTSIFFETTLLGGTATDTIRVHPLEAYNASKVKSGWLYGFMLVPIVGNVFGLAWSAFGPPTTILLREQGHLG